MYFSLFLLVWLTLPILGFWPIVKYTENEWYNNAIYIAVVDKTLVSQFTFLCGYAEEVTEWYIKSLCFGLLVLPFALLVAGWSPILNVAAVMLMQLAAIIANIPIFTRWIEYVGKSANIAVYPRDNKGSALRLSKYYSAFKGMDLEDIRVGIDRAAPVGKTLVWLLKYNISRHT